MYKTVPSQNNVINLIHFTVLRFIATSRFKSLKILETDVTVALTGVRSVF